MNQLKTLAALAIGAGALFACSESSELPIAPEDVPIQVAKGGNLGGGGGTSTETDPTATFYFPQPQETNGLWSDGGYLETDGPHTGLSRYQDGHCGVQAKIYATDDASGSGDATMNLRRSNGAKCNPFPRKLTITYGTRRAMWSKRSSSWTTSTARRQAPKAPASSERARRSSGG